MQMAQTIFGNGVQVVSASYSGSNYSSAVYSNGNAVSPNVVPGDTGVILSTGRASDFNNQGGGSNDSTSTSTNTGGQNNNPDFNPIAGTSTYDASYLDMTFIPTGDVMTIQFVFSSEEYPEYSNSIYNDVVGVWVNGALVPLSVTDSAASVTEINQTDNVNLFNNNTADQFNTEMDGFTVTMTLTIPVTSGAENTFRIGIADTSDSSYDSNLLIGGNSLQTVLVAQDDAMTVMEGQTKVIDILANDVNVTGGTLVVTHINGQAVSAGDTITLLTGQDVTLNADGTLTIVTDSDNDKISFTYGVESKDGSGNVLENDVGFVTVDTVPCFVAGTRITTPRCDVAVETLRLGDLVLTKDDGFQPLRWSGEREVRAEGKLAPIRILANTFGRHGQLMVSPLHRVLVSGSQAELLFGESEVLVAVRDLVNDVSIRPVEGGHVTYVHLMFDQHQVVFAEGLGTESFLPGPQTKSLFEREAVEEICSIFPELDPETGEGYGPAARRILRRYEAQLLVKAA